MGNYRVSSKNIYPRFRGWIILWDLKLNKAHFLRSKSVVLSNKSNIYQKEDNLYNFSWEKLQLKARLIDNTFPNIKTSNSIFI